MYLRVIHAEFDITALRRFIRENPLGILVTALPSAKFPTLQCTHIPWVLKVADEDSATELGTLCGHLARANSHSRAMVEAVEAAADGTLENEVTVMFTGPAHSYVSPQFYVQTKPASGKVVPTWNYAAVQAYGRATVHANPQNPRAAAFLDRQVRDLTRQSEEGIMGHTGGERPRAWAVDDAPAPFVELQKKAIVGIEIVVHRLEGKYKMSQERGRADRDGVVEGFRSLDTDAGLLMARMVEERGAKKDAEAEAARTASSS